MGARYHHIWSRDYRCHEGNVRLAAMAAVMTTAKSVRRSTGAFCACIGCTNSYRKKAEWRSSSCDIHEGTLHADCACLEPFSLHKFPKDNEQRHMWLAALKRKGYIPGKFAVVCSIHFKDGRPTKDNPYPTLALGHNEQVTTCRKAPQKSTKLERSLPEPVQALPSEASVPQKMDREGMDDQPQPKHCNCCRSKNNVVYTDASCQWDSIDSSIVDHSYARPSEAKSTSDFSVQCNMPTSENKWVPNLVHNDDKNLTQKSLGAMSGTAHVKEEPRDDSPNGHPTLVVKTNPYNATISAWQDETGYGCDSSSEGATASSGILHIKVEPKDMCDPVSSGSNSLNAGYNINTSQPSFDRGVPASVNSRSTDSTPRDVAPDKCKTLGKSDLSTSDHKKDNVRLATCVDIRHLEVCLRTKKANTFTCDSPSSFSLSENTNSHTRKHTNKKPYKCDLCYAKFSHSIRLQHHRRAHTAEKPYKCNLCPAAFSQGTDLRHHVQAHTGQKPYKCHLCSAEFGNSRNLQRHKQIHTGEKPHKCHLCPAEFNHSTHLKSHIRAHTGEKPYKCDLCPAEFSRSVNLRCHKHTHTGEKPYTCDLCPAEFTHSNSLRYHKHVHTGKKPYNCDLCPAGFVKSTNLWRHKQTHMGQKNVQV
ncbi:zinc finger protein ZFP2-like isoform X2 [Ornithodoros turicata]|uniref:zinc finger protein ZFP2-like isoform X2 n=1 Tax=Ornithodoros turicata TaxID=34597 RepID=UPI0031397443